VSTGVIDPLTGIPSQTTTEVTTRMIVPDGQTIFVGGLIKRRIEESKQGVPVISKVPLVGRLFSNRQQIDTNTETVVLITPTVVGEATRAIDREADERMRELEAEQLLESDRLNREMEYFFRPSPLKFEPPGE
ncbi:MAG: type II and III secretion system protein, partial [Gammaproteobacteria bacterium]|nr:type II and III secretion system protein [Gammaproteobacteria bacterium]